jgi:hypothetical protein
LRFEFEQYVVVVDRSSVPAQLNGAASKNLPVVFPLVVGVIKTIPPPGPISPTAHVPPRAHDLAPGLYVILETAVPVSPDTNPLTLTLVSKIDVAPVKLSAVGVSIKTVKVSALSITILIGILVEAP